MIAGQVSENGDTDCPLPTPPIQGGAQVQLECRGLGPLKGSSAQVQTQGKRKSTQLIECDLFLKCV